MRAPLSRVLTGAALSSGLVLASAGAALAESTHEVEAGETLAAIADQHDDVTSWEELYEANRDQLDDPNVVVEGQLLELPGAQTYEVQEGDTLASIVDESDEVSSWPAVAEANADVLPDPDVLPVGTVLRLTEVAPEVATEQQAEPEPQAEPEAQPEQEPQPEPTGTTEAATWDRLAQCEASGDWSANTGNGFYGGLQFTLDSWEKVGGTGYPHEASREEQIARAEDLLAIQGWGAWPSCSEQLGLR